MDNKRKITRASLAQNLYREVGFSREICTCLLHDCFAFIQEELEKGGTVKIAEFGTWTVYHKAPRKGRNPATGEVIHLPAKRAVKLTPSVKFKDALRHE